MSNDLTSGYAVLSRKIKVRRFSLFLLLFWLFPYFAVHSKNIKFKPTLSSAELMNLDLQSRLIIDTRSAWSYFLGHIPGAVRIPGWLKFTEKFNGISGLLIRNPYWIAEKLRSLGVSKHKVLVVYGDSSDPWRTDGRFFWMFHYYGFDNVAILDGGYEEWVNRGEPVERGTGTPAFPSLLTASDIHFNQNVIADQKWISQRLDSSSLVLIDNRTQEEFKGATPYGSPRGGHIPHAIHLDWRDLFTIEGKLKERTVLKSLLKGYGIEPKQEVVVYCTGGVRSGMAYYALKTLGIQVRNYDGSWWDWSHNPSLPTSF